MKGCYADVSILKRGIFVDFVYPVETLTRLDD